MTTDYLPKQIRSSVLCEQSFYETMLGTQGTRRLSNSSKQVSDDQDGQVNRVKETPNIFPDEVSATREAGSGNDGLQCRILCVAKVSKR